MGHHLKNQQQLKWQQKIKIKMGKLQKFHCPFMKLSKVSKEICIKKIKMLY